MTHEQAPEGAAPLDQARQIEEIITALTERGFYVMRLEEVAATNEPEPMTRRGGQTSH